VLHDDLEDLKLRSTILDGEIVALDCEGIPRFQLLQKWQKQPIAPVGYYVFDLLWHSGSDWTAQPLIISVSSLTRYLNLMVEFRSEVMSRSTELSFSGWQKKVLNEIWSRRFGNGTLRSGVLLHHPRLLSGLPFAGSLCSG
jgi:ATP-dependent DNA ligase